MLRLPGQQGDRGAVLVSSQVAGSPVGGAGWSGRVGRPYDMRRRRDRWARLVAGAWRRACRAWAPERAAGGCLRRVGSALVAVALLASSLALSGGAVVAQEPEDSESSESSAGSDAAGASQAGSGDWWDGTATLAAAPPVVVAEGACGSYGGLLGLFAGGSLADVCVGEAPGAPPGPVSGSPRGVGWFEGFDADGRFVGLELFGAPAIAEASYRTLGELDVVFDGGTFTADFSQCVHRATAGWSSCSTLESGASLPPGVLVGVATAGTEPPPRAPRGAVGTAATPTSERDALVALYDATDGANWTRNTNWNTTAAVSTWYGVTTDSDGSVTDLYLSSNSLSGSLPAELGDLTNLVTLDISYNARHFFSGRNLWGTIPPELGNLTKLVSLDLSSNRHVYISPVLPVHHAACVAGLSCGLFGSVPAELANLTNLEELVLFGNSLSGSIPSELGDLTSLDGLSLSVNELSGSVPAELGDLINLGHLDLSGNELSGSIPAELGKLSGLEDLSLSDNDLSGCVPAALAAVARISFDDELSYCRAPDLLAAVLAGDSTVELIYDLDLEQASVPSTGAFEVDVEGTDRAVTAVAVAGRMVTLTLAPATSSTARVVVSYTVPTAADAARIEGTGGDAATGFTDESVVRPPDPPVITDVLNRPGFGGGSWAWKREWSHGRTASSR